MTETKFIKSLIGPIDDDGLTNKAFRDHVRVLLSQITNYDYIPNIHTQALVSCYHGTTSKEKARSIIKNGFNPNTFFARNLEDAIFMGGKHVFQVLFRTCDLPENWQVRCLDRIPPWRILELRTYSKSSPWHENKILQSQFYSARLETPYQQPPYAFNDLWKKLN